MMRTDLVNQHNLKESATLSSMEGFTSGNIQKYFISNPPQQPSTDTDLALVPSHQATLLYLIYYFSQL